MYNDDLREELYREQEQEVRDQRADIEESIARDERENDPQ